jgi:hypothetical protein
MDKHKTRDREITPDELDQVVRGMGPVTQHKRRKIMSTAINVVDRELTTAELELVAGGMDTGTLNSIEVGIFTGFGFLAGLACYETGHVGYLMGRLH